MLMVISPAKDLDFETPAATAEYSQAELLPEAQQLVQICRQLSPLQLSQLMHISDKLAGLNAARFSDWALPFNANNAKAALYAFNGDVYQGLQAHSLSPSAVQYAQQHLRILSGLYGVLRPLDLVQPYRLEMGTALATPTGKGLYSFWDNKITTKLNQQLEQTGADYLLNLASIEYFKAVKPKQLSRPVIDVQFKDQKNGDYKVISFFAKKARGSMARYVLEQQVSTVEQLQGFAVEGYQYSAAASGGNKLVFLRSAAALEQHRLSAGTK